VSSFDWSSNGIRQNGGMDAYQAPSTRERMLDATERLIIDEGYAAVTVRRVARETGVAPALVQYYFRTLDDLFLAVLRRRSALEAERQDVILEGGHPLRALWEVGNDPGTVLITEFMALANHRKTIRSEIAAISEGYRVAQLESLTRGSAEGKIGLPDTPPVALLVLATLLSRALTMERSLGVTLGHQETLAVVEAFLSAAEGASGPRRAGEASEPRAQDE
jgi:AcrR family transcriptional regulator